MALTKAQRETVRLRFGGHCAYCGTKLEKGWHVDHLKPVHRRSKWVRGKGPVLTGEVDHPEREHPDNLYPACAPCNIDKHSSSLETWRKKLQDACNVMRRNSPTYKHALRFGLILETQTKIRFYFETHQRKLKPRPIKTP